MTGKRQKRKWARYSVKRTLRALNESAGTKVPLLGNEMKLFEGMLPVLGDGLLAAHRSSRAFDTAALAHAAERIDAVVTAVKTDEGLDEQWSKLMIYLAKPALAVYLTSMGRRDLGEAFLEFCDDARSQANVEYVPTDELALVADGGVGMFDPKFRDQAPNLARMIDEALERDDGPAPFDLEVVAGAGLSVRDPRVLSSTRPFKEQNFSPDDLAAITSLAAAIATGDADAGSLRLLTWMELEKLQAVVSPGNENKYTEEQVAGFPQLRALIELESDRRPT